MPKSSPEKSRDQLPPHSRLHPNQPKFGAAKRTPATPSRSMQPDLPELDNFQNGSDNQKFPTFEPHNQASAPDPTLKPEPDQSDILPRESEETHTAQSKVLRPRTNPESMAPNVGHLTDDAPIGKLLRRSTPTTTQLLRSIHTGPAL